MIAEVGEDLEKELSWKLENCTIYVSASRDRLPNTHSRWSGPVESFASLHGPGGPLPPIAVWVASLLQSVGRERWRRECRCHRPRVSSSGDGMEVQVKGGHEAPWGTLVCVVTVFQSSALLKAFDPMHERFTRRTRHERKPT